ncbi:MAG TPA: PIG-L family deacetylase [Gemmatimonadota bacterium]|nr:PIG-L family deacetylase [Gemmatimonadota bacterium]
MKRSLAASWAVLLAASLPSVAAAQGGAVDPDHGLLAVARDLRALGSVKRVLIIGAHPDDEDTALLTVLELGFGADAAYLSLNRGEGGQNLIGPELGVALGVLRTEELIAARQLDGASQFFTRAFDFGYSKSADEAFRLWPRDSLLADVVGVIRRFRPQILISIFSGTPRDGHGQHQAAGILAVEAFDAAADPARFPDQLSRGLEPWAPVKLYRSTRFDRDAATLAVETGVLDPLYGRSYHQIAMASRSQHRSQDMGRIEDLGPQRTSLQLVESRVDTQINDESSIFDGVDTTLIGMITAIRDRNARSALAELLTGYDAHLRDARSALGRASQTDLVAHLSLALSALREALEVAASAGREASFLRFALTAEEARLEDATAEAAGVIVEAFADDDLVTPGQSLQVDVQVWNGGEGPVDVQRLALRTPAGWRVEPLDGAVSQVAPDSLARLRYRLTVPRSARPSRPYYLQVVPDGAVYAWPPESGERGSPRGAPVVQAEVEVGIAGRTVTRRAEVVHRFADQARGEVRRPVYVVPAIGVRLTPATAILPLGRPSEPAFKVALRSEAAEATGGRLWIEAPEGWSVNPPQVTFTIAPRGSTATFEFHVSAPAGLTPGAYLVSAVLETGDGQRSSLGYNIIDYEHVRRNVLLEPATARVEAFDLAVDTERRIAYVPGPGDVTPAAIAALGLDLTVLDDAAVAAGDLSIYDVIVFGIRAYETNVTLIEANERFLEWVRDGGTLIVQYQQYAYFGGDFAPYSLRARRPHDRVSDETVPVRILAPDHPALTRPNPISADDFENWVQERGLYFASEWDERYQPLLEMADPGEDPKRGSLLVARYGDGLYVYTGLALFRQLSAGVPGAYRLLANLLSLNQ